MYDCLACICVCVPCDVCIVLVEARTIHHISWTGTYMLRIEPSSCGRAVSSFYHWAISSAPIPTIKWWSPWLRTKHEVICWGFLCVKTHPCVLSGYKALCEFCRNTTFKVLPISLLWMNFEGFTLKGSHEDCDKVASLSRLWHSSMTMTYNKRDS